MEPTMCLLCEFSPEEIRDLVQRATLKDAQWYLTRINKGLQAENLKLDRNAFFAIKKFTEQRIALLEA